MPAVEAASLARIPPGGWEGIGLGGVIPEDWTGSAETFSAGWNIVDSGYFTTLRIPLLGGRDIAPHDTDGAPPVVVLSDALARRIWPGQSAIGKLLRLPPVNARDGRVEQRVATVIGVAADIRSSSLVDGLAEPYVYLPLAQTDALGMTGQMSIVARRRGAASLAPLMATLVQDIDRRLVLARAESLEDAIALGLTPQRILAAISSFMGLVALLMVSMGIYGVTAYAVALRRREFAIRLALGASPTRVVQMVLGQGAWLLGLGLGIGLVLAFGAGQVLSVLFYGLPAAHVPTFRRDRRALPRHRRGGVCRAGRAGSWRRMAPGATGGLNVERDRANATPGSCPARVLRYTRRLGIQDSENLVSQPDGDDLRMIRHSRLHPPDPERARRTGLGSAGAFENLLRKANENPHEFWARRGRRARVDAPVGYGLRRRLPALPVLRRRREQPDAQPARSAPGAGRRQPSGAHLGRRGLRDALLHLPDARRRGEQCANVLKQLGVRKGDAVGIFTPNLAETAIAVLACFRIGALFNTVFSGFSTRSLRDRLDSLRAEGRRSRPTAGCAAGPRFR